ncbi:MAG: right-handed parallel beta-helix repeat-containing protein [Deltaproteobacteria bacterium]|nr:right-handed parallel beta-helix repeat-containing protein [Deltaproteobacteria bacterium]
MRTSWTGIAGLVLVVGCPGPERPASLDGLGETETREDGDADVRRDGNADGRADEARDDDGGEGSDGGGDGEDGDVACTPERMCHADFPCDISGSYYRPHCEGDVVMTPDNVPCWDARVCGTSCCEGGRCFLEATPCPAGLGCTDASGYPQCVPGCWELATFADSAVYLRTVHVAPYGDDETGDGTEYNPYATLQRAARDALPGDSLALHPGMHAGDQRLERLQGTEANPIRIGRWFPEYGGPDDAAVVSGGTEAIHLVDPRWVVIEDLEINLQTSNGIVIESGGAAAVPADVVIRRVTMWGVGATGEGDFVKLSRADRVAVLDSQFGYWSDASAHGAAIDMIGCRDALVARNHFTGGGAFGVGASWTAVVQARGGSSEVTIARNRISDGGDRPLGLGGRTDPALLRPGADYEARDIRAIGNVVLDSTGAIAFVGCDGCLAANNTVVHPTGSPVRILQESVHGYVPCRAGRVVNNLVVFSTADVTELVEVGSGPEPGTFIFSHDLWFADDDPGFVPSLPVVETGTVAADPRFVDAAGYDYHLAAGSPALGAGVAVLEVTANADGACPADPPNIGAY